MKIGVHCTLTYYPDYDQFPIAVTITLPIILLIAPEEILITMEIFKSHSLLYMLSLISLNLIRI